MAENKTKATDVPVEAFLETVTPPQRRADALVLIDLMRRLSGHEPVMWGPSIIGFGLSPYTTPAGRTGVVGEIGFSPRKAQQVLYIGAPGEPDLLARLGKHSIGKSCLYITRLSDVDMEVVEALIVRSLKRHREAAA